MWLFEAQMLGYTMSAMVLNYVVFAYAPLTVAVFHQIGTILENELKINTTFFANLAMFAGGLLLLYMSKRLHDSGHYFLSAVTGVAGLYNIIASIVGEIMPILSSDIAQLLKKTNQKKQNNTGQAGTK